MILGFVIFIFVYCIKCLPSQLKLLVAQHGKIHMKKHRDIGNIHASTDAKSWEKFCYDG